MRNKALYIKLTLFIISLFLLCSCSSSTSKSNEKTKTITVSAAASLTSFLDEIIKQFEHEHKHIDVLVNYGSSGSLQRQIEQGAPIDLFLSAGSIQIERLEEKGLVVSDSVKPLLANTLVVIESRANNNTNASTHTSESKMPHSLKELFNSKQAKYIAIGEPNTVPAGIYARQALQHEKVWEQWEPYFVYGKDVREVLAYVEQGNAELGIVYASNALSSNKVTVLYEMPAELHDPILYIGAIVEASEQQDTATLFLSYLNEIRWKNIYEQHGFIKVD